ncbi:MAG: hypothetical protein WB988_07350 [Candidatus Nitrosopolaris sp.]
MSSHRTSMTIIIGSVIALLLFGYFVEQAFAQIIGTNGGAAGGGTKGGIGDNGGVGTSGNTINGKNGTSANGHNIGGNTGSSSGDSRISGCFFH